MSNIDWADLKSIGGQVITLFAGLGAGGWAVHRKLKDTARADAIQSKLDEAAASIMADHQKELMRRHDDVDRERKLRIDAEIEKNHLIEELATMSTQLARLNSNMSILFAVMDGIVQTHSNLVPRHIAVLLEQMRPQVVWGDIMHPAPPASQAQSDRPNKH